MTQNSLDAVADTPKAQARRQADRLGLWLTLSAQLLALFTAPFPHMTAQDNARFPLVEPKLDPGTTQKTGWRR